MKHFLQLFWALILVSCAGVNEIITDAPIYPNWISSRPISTEYYIGIAKASKANPDYQSIAKQNALVDLSSEISVKLSSESIFHQVDKGDSYREEYQSLIQIESQKNLEAYTLLASWENENEYWLYYQLSKSEWKQLRTERKQKAISQAYNYYKLAEKFSDEMDLVSSVHHAVKALDVLKLYMNESLIHPELEFPIDLLCFQFLSDAHSSIIFDVVEGKQYRELILMGTDISLEPFDVTVGKAGIPFKIKTSFKGAPNTIFSNSSGLLQVRVTEMDVYRKEHFVQFILDWEQMLTDANASTWLKSLLKFPERTYKISLKTLWPKIAIISTELNLGKTMSQSILLNETTNYLKEKGFTIVAENKADFIISISADTKKGQTNNTMHTAMLEYEFVVNNTADKTTYQKQERALKGVQANYYSAGINAYERCLDDFKWTVLRNYLKYLEGN